MGTWTNTLVVLSGSKVNLALLLEMNFFISTTLNLKQLFSETKGTDLTEAFESAHMDIVKARAILKKFFVKDIDTSRKFMSTFEPDGFYSTMRDR